MYHDFESHTITRRSFLKGAGAVGAASLLAACGGSSSTTTHKSYLYFSLRFLDIGREVSFFTSSIGFPVTFDINSILVSFTFGFHFFLALQLILLLFLLLTYLMLL